jgi:hypothetical protein
MQMKTSKPMNYVKVHLDCAFLLLFSVGKRISTIFQGTEDKASGG